MYFGDFPASATVEIPFYTLSAGVGPATITGFAAGDIRVYKTGSLTQRASTAGYTAFTDYDGATGLHVIRIDCSDDTDAGFYTANTFYLVSVGPYTLDGQSFTHWAGTFSLGVHKAALVAALNSDTYAEPGQGSLPASPTIREAIGFLYKFLRNKRSVDQTTGVLSIYNNDESTIGQKSIKSTSGGITTRSEITSGP